MKYSDVCRDCGGWKFYGQQVLCDPCQSVYGTAMRECNRVIHGEKSAGRLPNAKTLICVDCGAQAHDYDHRDYRKPLDVVPVCRSCNLKRGPAEYDRTHAVTAQAA